MIYTCYEMVRDCRAGRAEGWRYFVASYVPVIRKLLAHYQAGGAARVKRDTKVQARTNVQRKHQKSERTLHARRHPATGNPSRRPRGYPWREPKQMLMPRDIYPCESVSIRGNSSWRTKGNRPRMDTDSLHSELRKDHAEIESCCRVRTPWRALRGYDR